MLGGFEVSNKVRNGNKSAYPLRVFFHGLRPGSQI